MTDDSGQGDATNSARAIAEGTAPNDVSDSAPLDTVPGSPDSAAPGRRPRGRPNFRGHIVIDDGEPLPVFDEPADPPPASPAPADGQVSPDP